MARRTTVEAGKVEIRGTREWAVAEINCCLGCAHDCLYCYARISALKKGLIENGEQWRSSRTIDEWLKREYPLFSGQVMFPTSHDIVEENLDAAIEVIEKLLNKGNRVLVVSKPHISCISRLCDRFSDQRDQMLFRFSITAGSDDILSFWEPGAPLFQERVDALSLAYNRGFATSVSIEPMLDVPNVAELVSVLEPWVSHSIWLGKMNRIRERVHIDTDLTAREVARIEKEQDTTRILSLYEKLADHPLVRWKESVKQVVGLPMPEEPGLDQ